MAAVGFGLHECHGSTTEEADSDAGYEEEEVWEVYWIEGL